MEAGFTEEEAESVARWDVRTDRGFPGRRWVYKGYHLNVFGCRRTGQVYLARAIRERSIRHLGVALHCEQDALSHGIVGSIMHWPGIDIWQRRSQRVRARLERVTKEWVEAYLDFRVPEGISVPEPLPPAPLPPDLPWP